MPITEMYFKDGIFFAKETGRIDKEDARLWAERAREYAAASSEPIAAVVDALDVSYVTSDARQIFVRASKTPNLVFAAVATQDIITTQTANIIGMMSEKEHTYIFATLQEALTFARTRLDAAATG